MSEFALLDYAACRNVDTDVFFPTPGQSYHAAKAVCDRCPVRSACLRRAMEAEALQVRQGGRAREARHGMFGGLTPDERHALAMREDAA